jgi:hypothetical protein
VHDRQVDGSSVRARAHLLLRRPHASFSAGRARLRHPTRAFTRDRPRHSPGAPVPIARRQSARPASRLLRALLAMRCPGSGPSARPSGSRLGPFRRCCRGSPARQPEPTAGWRDCPRLRSLLAANQWIAESSAVVEPILRGPSPHSLPIESLLLPGVKARPTSSRRENVESRQKGRGGTGCHFGVHRRNRSGGAVPGRLWSETGSRLGMDRCRGVACSGSRDRSPCPLPEPLRHPRPPGPHLSSHVDFRGGGPDDR